MRRIGHIGLIFIFAALGALAQERVELTIGVTVAPERIVFQSLEFHPETVVTNITREWETAVEIRTNLYYGMKPDEVVTNTVQQQVTVAMAVTNAAFWTAPFEYTIPAGEPMLMAGALDARPRRASTMDVRLILTHEQLSAILGPEFAGQTRAAAEAFGPLPVKGSLADALRAAVLQAMLPGGVQ
jgi:hypothetical protein